MSQIETLISKEKIQKRIIELAKEIDQKYHGQDLVVIGVLNGAFMFMADLVREVKTPHFIDFIAVSSYEGTESTGKVNLDKDIKIDVKGKHVLLVEDIVDTGLTISELKKMFNDRGTASVSLASLLHKSVKTVHDVTIDFLGFEIEDKFVIGYGLDFDGRYRELPYIGVYNES